MPVPPFAAFWLPVLRHLSNGHVWTPTELVDVIATEFDLSPDDRTDSIASGRTRVSDRILWTITYLRQAGVVESPQRGRVRITDRGKLLLQQSPDRLDRDQLLQFPEFRDFMKRKRTS